MLILMASGSAEAMDRRVVIETDGRAALSTAGADRGGARFAATGRIECGGVRGVGQITGRADRVTSAAHVFFDEAGRSRAEGGRCVMIFGSGEAERTFDLVPDASTCGSTSPYAAAGHHDWAVARLVGAPRGVAPYDVAGDVRPGTALRVVSFEAGQPVIDACRVRAVVAAPGGGREVRTDCVGVDGMSGAAYLTVEPKPRLAGLHVGWRSRNPDRASGFSEDHHTFGVAPDGAFARALKSGGR
jgi:hypothetical protein